MSAAESVIGAVLSAVIAVIANQMILPLFGFYPSMRQTVGMVALFFIVSMIRSYLIRRLFNWLQVQGIN